MNLLTWVGFIGRLIELLVVKVAGKKIDLTLDRKKKAAQVFVSLYDAVLFLETVTGQFLRNIQPVVDGRKFRIYSFWIKDLSSEIEDASVRFLSGLNAVLPVIEFYDPNLTALLSEIRHGKSAFLEEMALGGLPLSPAFAAMKFEVGWDGKPQRP